MDADFFDIAAQVTGHGTPRLVAEVRREVWKLYGRVSGVSLESYYRDIETREMVGAFAKSTNKPKDWRRRCTQLDEVIRRVLIQTTKPTKSNQVYWSKSHAAILTLLKKGDTVLTFNYDTVIEESFDGAQLWTPLDGYEAPVHNQRAAWVKNWFKIRGREGHPLKSKINILKLHGAVNWVLYKQNGQIKMKARPYSVRGGKKRAAVHEKVSILPPGWNKQISKYPYSELWRKARLELEKCKTLLIVGYSMPETDLLAKALFVEVVRHRQSARKSLANLVVADPDSKVKEKFIELFTPILGAKGRVIAYDGIEALAQDISWKPKS
jgi:hypothetical protein